MKFLVSLISCLLLAAPAVAGTTPLSPTPSADVHVYSIPAGFTLPSTDLGKLGEGLTGKFKPINVLLVEGMASGCTVANAKDCINDIQDPAVESLQGVQGDNTLITIIWGTDCDKPPKMRAQDGRGVCQVGLAMSQAIQQGTGIVPRNDAQRKPYTDLFINSVKSRPQNPQGGILQMASTLNSVILDTMDPVVIKARAEAFEAAQKAAFLASARSNLDKQIAVLAGLLEGQDLPADVSGYKTTLNQARDVRAKDVPTEMAAFAKDMTKGVTALSELVAEATSKRQKETFLAGLGYLMLLGVLLYSGRKVVLRVREYKTLQANFTTAFADWMAKVVAANNKFLAFKTNREDFTLLRQTVGATKVYFTACAHEIDDLFLSIDGLTAHLNRCKRLFDTGSLFNFGPIIQATKDLDGEFTHDTGKVNRDDLFGGDTITIKTTARKFTDDAAARFRAASQKLDRLREAAISMQKSAEEHFPQSTLDTLVAECKAAGIPANWYDDHPLMGNEDQDKALYASLNTLRYSDPLTFFVKVTDLKTKESEVQARITELTTTLKKLEAARFTGTVNLFGLKVRESDNPQTSLDEARKLENLLGGDLASTTNLRTIYDRVTRIVTVYTEVRRLQGVLETASKNADATIGKAVKAREDADTARDRARVALVKAAEIHKDVSSIENETATGAEAFRRGDIWLNDARTHAGNNEALEASRTATDGLGCFTTALQYFNKAVDAAKKLDDTKALFEKKAAALETTRQKESARIKQFGGTPKLNPATTPVVPAGRVDFNILLSTVTTQEAEWDREASRVQRAYEEEQARLAAIARRRREEEEAAERRRRDEEAAARRRREEEAAEASRRSSWSSGSSSSSSSWGGSSSSSSDSWGGSSSSGSDSGGSSGSSSGSDSW